MNVFKTSLSVALLVILCVLPVSVMSDRQMCFGPTFVTLGYESNSFKKEAAFESILYDSVANKLRVDDNVQAPAPVNVSTIFRYDQGRYYLVIWPQRKCQIHPLRNKSLSNPCLDKDAKNPFDLRLGSAKVQVWKEPHHQGAERFLVDPKAKVPVNSYTETKKGHHVFQEFFNYKIFDGKYPQQDTFNPPRFCNHAEDYTDERMDKYCRLCQETVTETLSLYLSGYKSEKKIEKVLRNDFCPNMRISKKLCLSFVSNNIDAIYHKVASGTKNPRKICREIHQC